VKVEPSIISLVNYLEKNVVYYSSYLLHTETSRLSDTSSATVNPRLADEAVNRQDPAKGRAKPVPPLQNLRNIV
jgi:hypothetical protein